MKAFRTMCIGTESIIFAESRSQAKYVTFRDANDAGYAVSFMDITKAVRAPEFDIMQFSDGSRAMAKRSYGREFLKQTDR